MERAASGTKWYKNTKIDKNVHSCFSGNAFQGARFSTNNAAFITLSSCHNWQTDAISIWTTLYWYLRYILRQSIFDWKSTWVTYGAYICSFNTSRSKNLCNVNTNWSLSFSFKLSFTNTTPILFQWNNCLHVYVSENKEVNTFEFRNQDNHLEVVSNFQKRYTIAKKANEVFSKT